MEEGASHEAAVSTTSVDPCHHNTMQEGVYREACLDQYHHHQQQETHHHHPHELPSSHDDSSSPMSSACFNTSAPLLS